MAQPLAEIGAACREEDVLLHVDATATISGIDMRVDEWQIDVLTAGLQKCLSGPPGCAPITFNERVEARVSERKHIEQGIRPTGFEAATGPIIASNYFDITMLMDIGARVASIIIPKPHRCSTPRANAPESPCKRVWKSALRAMPAQSRRLRGARCDGTRALRRSVP